MSTTFWLVLHSLKKYKFIPERAVALASWRDVDPSNMKLAEGCYESYKTTANHPRRNRKKAEASRATSLVFIAASRQSHIVRNDVTPGGHSKLKTHNAVFWQPLENDFDSNG